MDDFEVAYQKALVDVESSITQSLMEIDIPSVTDIELIEKSESSLDSWDYCYAIAIGLAGVFISTNEVFGKYLEGIHEAASDNSGAYGKYQAFLGKILHHEGDYIDAIELPFKNRNGGNAYCLFHRLLWGHDIFSNKGDNPFSLMFQQKGMRGILQAMRHLLADTCSRQGLPLPGSSYLDYVDENNKTSNYLINVAQTLSEESTGNKTSAQKIYSHIMTFRAQDVTAGVVVKLVSELYFTVRKITDSIRKTEIQLIAYAVNFLGEAVIGCIKQKGVPYINVPLGTAMGVSFIKFCYLNEKDIRRLTKQTEDLHAKVEELIAEDEQTDGMLPAYNTADEMLTAADAAEANVNELLDIFGEDNT